MPLVLAKCTECGGTIKVESEKKLGVCEHCGEPFVVEDAINNFTNYYTTNYITNNNTTHNYGDGAVVNVYEDTNKDFVIEAGVLKEYHGEATEVVLPDGVQEISSGCFNGMHITSIKLPASLKNLNNIASLGIFNSVEVDENNPNLIIKNNVIYSFDEKKVEAFVGWQKEYSLSDSVTILSSTAEKQLEYIEHIYFNNNDLKEINCNEQEIINCANKLGISPIIKHELVENKCVNCKKYIFNSSQKESYKYSNTCSNFDVSLNFIDNEKVAFSNYSIYGIWAVSSEHDIDAMRRVIKNSLRKKLSSVHTLILLNLNEKNEKYCETFGLHQYSPSMENLLTVLFPNVKSIIIEEDTGYYDEIEEKQVSLLNELVLPFIQKKLMQCGLDDVINVSYNHNLPNKFITSLNEIIKSAEERKEKLKEQKRKEEQRKHEAEMALQFRNQMKCQHCGGEFNLFNKCKKCGMKKDY